MLDFVKSVFSEDGQGSYSRIASALITLGCLGWVTHVVYKTHGIPDLTGVGTFLATGVGVHYGVNKANDFIESGKGYLNKSNDKPNPPQGG